MTLTDTGPRGPQSENPVFETVHTQPNYAGTADGPIRYPAVYAQDQPVAYLWAAADDSAAGVLPRKSTRPDAFNAAAGWYDRLRKAYAQGLPPLEVLRHWAGTPVDPADQRCGVIRSGEECEAATLADLEVLAAR